MPIQTAQQRENTALTGYAASAAFAALYTTAPGGSAGTEVTGGSPAYARKALTWTPGTVDGVITASATFDVPAVTVAGAGIHTAVSGGTYLDGISFTQVFSSQGTLTVNFTYTQA